MSDWFEEALCKDMPNAMFFPHPEPRRNRPGSYARAWSAARAVCARCPVKSQCLEHGLALGALYGMFGGMTAEERRDEMIRRERNRRSVRGVA